MYPAGNIFISVAHGQLEAILKEPTKEPVGSALVLHPLPTGGGTMHNKVVFRAAAALNETGLTTLRINFRGVGQSSGTFDEGKGELEDSRDALNYLIQNYPKSPLIVCGFSFGARVGMETGIADDRVDYLISLGTPLDKYDFNFLTMCRKPILFVHGELDEFGASERMEALIRELEPKAEVRLVIIPHADHFFEGHLNEVKKAIFDWVTIQLSKRQ